MSSTARMRWNILSKALNPKPTPEEELGPQLGSVRQFESFGLIRLKPKDFENKDSVLNNDSNERHRNEERLQMVGKWFECRLWNDSEQTFDETVVDIRLLTEKIPIYELLHSFDNTGNVCLWPSEEILTYYCYKNGSICSGGVVCELGGGMTGLCGLVTAIVSSPKRVIITDGNERCVSNVESIVDRNRHRLQSVVDCRQLKWGEDSHFEDLCHKIDVIFCSDCLYFDESRPLLVDTIDKLLNSTGIAILFAPKRGSTFNSFVDLAKEKFELKVIENYDKIVYELHQNFVKTANNCHYIPDLHYPVMIEMRRKTSV